MPAKPHAQLNCRSRNSICTWFLPSQWQASRWSLQWRPREADRSSKDRLLHNDQSCKPGRHSHLMATWYHDHTTRRLSRSRSRQRRGNLDLQQNRWIFQSFYCNNNISTKTFVTKFSTNWSASNRETAILLAVTCVRDENVTRV